MLLYMRSDYISHCKDYFHYGVNKGCNSHALLYHHQLFHHGFSFYSTKYYKLATLDLCELKHGKELNSSKN